MIPVAYRQISEQDVPSLAQIRATNSGSLQHWSARITNYLCGVVNPQNALAQRIIYCAEYDGAIVAFVAGHLSTRFGCEGELQWIDTKSEFRGKGVGSHLVQLLAYWFISNKAYKICVDPGDQISRKFYEKNGAVMLNEHWMYWNDVRAIIS